jgi:hypothetical protein
MQLSLHLLVLAPAAEVHYILRFFKDPSTNRAWLQDMQGNKVQLKQQPVVFGNLTLVPVEKVLMSGKHNHGKRNLSSAVLGANTATTSSAELYKANILACPAPLTDKPTACNSSEKAARPAYGQVQYSSSGVCPAGGYFRSFDEALRLHGQLSKASELLKSAGAAWLASKAGALANATLLVPGAY